MTKQRAALISVFSNSALILLKIMAGLAMGSVSVISEAIHSAIDLLASCVAYFSIKKSLEPADSDHPYGHGKFENISGFFEAILIFGAAALIVYEAIQKLLHPTAVEKLGWGMAVMGISIVVNIIVSRTLFVIAKRENSIALEADAMHLWTDVFTSCGVLAGLLLIHFTHLQILDPIVAIFVAGMIVKASWDLTRKSLDDLADRSLPPGEIEAICRILGQHPQILGFHKMRSRRIGNRRELDLHLTIDKLMRVVHAHALCDTLENEIEAILPGITVTIHIEPYISRRAQKHHKADA